MEDLSGKDLGRYHIVCALGEGGMASVYKAFDTRLERYVAIKVIRVEKGQDISFLKRFERESKALARLNHPNIVHVNDYGEQDGVPYLVMDYLPGGTLKQKLGQPMPFQEAARMIIPMARALHHAHENGIVHRDVKPANMLLTAGGLPMLSDFGIAKMLESEQTSELTGTGMGIGTPEYMAPEQGTGEKVDERADIYALGVVFYELVAGRKPFRADTPMAVVIKHMTEPLPRPDLFVPGLPEEVDQIIFKAMAKRPEDRYQTMEQFALALEHLLQSSTTLSAGGYSPAPRPSAQTAAPSSTQLPAIPPPGPGVKKPPSVPVLGTLVSVAAVLLILGLLVLCVIGVVFKINSFGPASTPAQAQAATKPVQVAANSKTVAPTRENNNSTQSAPASPQATSSVVSTDTPTPLPTSEQMTVSGNGYTSIILVNRDGSAAAGESKDITDAAVPAGMDQLAIYITWDEASGSLDPLVTMPDGTKLTRQSKVNDMQLITNSNMFGFMLLKPAAGNWKIGIQNVKTTKDKLTYHLMVQCSQQTK